jgi:glucose/arabinose dehydrogenase
MMGLSILRYVYQAVVLGAILLLSSCSGSSTATGDAPPPTAPPTNQKIATAGCTSASTGAAAFSDYTTQTTGLCHLITASDLPKPAASSTTNYSTLVARKNGQMPIAPAGFSVQLYATGFSNARLLATAPNGDIFLADSGGNAVRVRFAVSCLHHECRN